MQEAGVVGVVVADLAEPAHRRAVELELVDRLPGADPAQLRRAVGGEHDQRHRGLVGLADRGVQVRRRGARGAEDRDRRAGSPARRRARRSPPSARRRSRRASIAGSPPAAPAPAGSSASRGRSPRGARRSGRAPRPAPRRARCCGWSRSMRNARFAARARASSSSSTPRPGPSAGSEQRSPRASGSTAAIVVGEQQLGREPVREPGRGAARGQRLGGVRGGGDPERAVERAGEVDRQAPWRSRSPRRSRRPWRASPSPGRRRVRAFGPLGVLGRARRSRRRRSGSRALAVTVGHLARRVATGCSTSSIPSGSISRSTPSASSALQAPLASTRIRASGPTASRTARTWATSSPAPSLSLKVAKPRRGPALGVGGDLVGRPGDEGRVAGAPASASVAAEQRPERPPRRLAGEVEDRHLDRRLRRGRRAGARRRCG